MAAPFGLRRRDDHDIDRMGCHCADTTHPLLLAGGEQLAQQRQGKRIDLIQEQGSCGGRFEEAPLARRASVKAPTS
jgi:hypothetical protein